MGAGEGEGVESLEGREGNRGSEGIFGEGRGEESGSKGEDRWVDDEKRPTAIDNNPASECLMVKFSSSNVLVP